MRRETSVTRRRHDTPLGLVVSAGVALAALAGASAALLWRAER
jgi:hypothetical protein